MIKLTSKGSFSNSFKFLRFLSKKGYLAKLDEYGRRGVAALSANTPVDTGKTAASWGYEIQTTRDSITITWTNSNRSETGIPIVVLLYYGHATARGAYVQGRDFITPAIRPVFDEIAEKVWKEVENA